MVSKVYLSYYCRSGVLNTNLSFIQNRNFFQFKYSVVLSFLLGFVIISMKIIVQIKIRISLLFSSEECKKQCNAWIVGNYIRDV